MTIVFIHYHLKPGGVTRVIQQQADICQRMGWNYLILAGENPLQLEGVRIIEDLHYDLHRSPAGTDPGVPAVAKNAGPAQLSEIIRQAVLESLGCTDDGAACADIFHVHNATLAKNSDLLPALHILKAQGSRLLLQLHDFAEDGRPAVYSSSPYPADVFYACINSRDAELLQHAGVAPDRMTLLPNLVSPLPQIASPRTASTDSSEALDQKTEAAQPPRYALYPVRGIRRKNLGEALLLSLLVPNLKIGVTLEPNNPVDLPSYHGWQDLAEQLNAPMQFASARQKSFEACLDEADFFISTSVQEGFGFAFLEPWTIHKAVAGRRIPYVHRDFAAEGLEMDYFYDQIPIPAIYIDIELFRRTWLLETEQRLSRFRMALRNQNMQHGATRTQQLSSLLPQHFERLYASKPMIDFARLDPANQKSVCRLVAKNPEICRTILTSVPHLNKPPFQGPLEQCTPSIVCNAERVRQAYGSQRYTERLQATYERVITNQPDPEQKNLDKETLLFSFLDPDQVFLLTSMD